MLTGTEYDKALENETGFVKQSNKRHSAREKRPPILKDFGYVDKSDSKKNKKKSVDGYEKCEHVLDMLKKHPSAAQFTNLLSIPGYAEHIQNPIDLSILETNLKGRIYTTSGEFLADGNRIWENTQSIFAQGSDLYNACTEIGNYFKTLMAEVGNIPMTIEEPQHTYKNSGTKVSSSNGSSKCIEKPLSNNEKVILRQSIMKLTQDKLQGVIQIIQSSINTSKNNETLE